MQTFQIWLMKKSKIISYKTQRSNKVVVVEFYFAEVIKYAYEYNIYIVYSCLQFNYKRSHYKLE